MKSAFIKLHLSVLLAGVTGIFGRLITLNEGLLIFYRMLTTSIAFFIILNILGWFRRLPFRDVRRIAALGFLLSIHWIFFYGSIKVSNVSVGVVCCSLTGFFTAIFEPIILKRRFMIREILFSCIALFGVLLIFHFDSRYRLGIIFGITSAMLFGLYTIANKRLSTQYPLPLLFWYQMAGGLLILTVVLPVYLQFAPSTVYYPSGMNLVYLLIFAIFCTIIMYMLQLSALRQISAFTVNLSYNIEPIYTITLAAIIFNEMEELNASFFVGLGLIMLSVLLQMLAVLRDKRKMAISGL
ncbi:MAG: DMT family transporter [Deferribacteraceae bacterium]|jgi:drug/metabolite transporter (DMT)-like permease|nr:DMT family transporter [Deferribacteraceae bacterium]